MRTLASIAATALAFAALTVSAAQATPLDAPAAAPAAQAAAPAVQAAAPAPQAQPHVGAEVGPQQIVPQNAVENAFVAALTNPEMRPVFRRSLLESQVAVALGEPGENAAPRMVPIQNNAQAAAIFTSAARLQQVMGADAPYVMLTGRAALIRLHEHNVAINYMWAPMLTLEPEDIAHWIETPAEPAEGAPQPDAPLALPH